MTTKATLLLATNNLVRQKRLTVSRDRRHELGTTFPLSSSDTAARKNVKDPDKVSMETHGTGPVRRFSTVSPETPETFLWKRWLSWKHLIRTENAHTTKHKNIVFVKNPPPKKNSRNMETRVHGEVYPTPFLRSKHNKQTKTHLHPSLWCLKCYTMDCSTVLKHTRRCGLKPTT